jgi:hypothetical protein
MGVVRELYLFFLTDTGGRSYYVNNGSVLKDNHPHWLPEAPDGWKDITLSFARNTKYYGLNRSFAPSLKFVGDGASIIRNLFYTKKGIDQDLFLNVNKWDDITGIYQPYYKGQLDLSKMNDESAIGVTVPFLESGIVQVLKSNEDNTFELPCDGTDPRNIRIRFDGIKFRALYHYTGINFSVETAFLHFTYPIGFVNTDGDSIGIESGTENYENSDEAGDNSHTYVQTSGNYIFSTTSAISVRIKGKLRIRLDAVDLSDHSSVKIKILTSLLNLYVLYDFTSINVGEIKEFPIDITINLSPGEKIFLLVDNPPVVPTQRANYTFFDDEITIEFDSRYRSTLAWGWKASDLLQALIQKASNGIFSASSDLLDRYNHLVLTSGASLRQTPSATIKTSITDFFKSFNAILNASLGVLPPGNIKYSVIQTAFTNTAKFLVANNSLEYNTLIGFSISPGDIIRISGSAFNNGRYTVGSVLLGIFGPILLFSDGTVKQDESHASIKIEKISATINQSESLFLEEKKFVFNPLQIDLDLGEVSGLQITPENEYFFNNLKIGYPEQQYDERQGQLEYNTTAEWQSPLKNINKKAVELISVYRADSYGIEYTRFLAPGNQTVNNKSDNSVFVIAIDKQAAAPVTATVSFSSSLGMMITPLGINFAQGQQIRITGSASNDGVYTVTSITESFFIQFVSLSGSLTDETDASVLIEFMTGVIYDLLRETYDSITGIINPETAFNIADLTPKRMLLKHGNYIRGSLYNRATEYLTFLNLNKNKELATQQGTTFVIEKTDQPIGQLDAPLFYPYIASFKTKVPLTFEEIMNKAVNGHIRFTYNGVEMFGFPMEVSVKPSLNDSQEWKLLLSPSTNLSKLQDLDINGLNFLVMNDLSVFVPHLCPAKFVPLGINMPAQYHFKHMDEWWHSEQIQHYVEQNTYAQKWQTNDEIKIQCQTNGLGPVQVDLLDCEGKVLNSVSFSTVSDPSVISPMILFEGNIPLVGLEDGYYYLLLTAGTGGTIAQMLSEPLYVKENHENTLLFEYTNAKNKQACIFSSGYDPSIRVEGWMDDFSAEGIFTSYVNQPADIETLNGIPYRTYKLNIGFNRGLPDWMADKINRIMMLNSVKIDGKYFSRDSDAKMEKTTVPGSPLKYWTLIVREGKNRDGISLSTSGQLDNELTVAYNINTKAFGDGAGSDNIVQVEKVD